MNPFTSARRVARFTAVMYKPHYLLYGILWTLAVEGTAALVTVPDTAWRPTGATLLRIVVIAFVLLYLRMVDEQKDLDYDRVHNPDRPLVTSAVSATELRVSMALIAAGAIAASAALSAVSALSIAAALGYGLLLWWFERLSATVRANVLLNLAITYPVQLLLTAYVLLSAADTGETGLGWSLVPVVVLFAGAFLQFEIARKTSRDPRPSEMYYSEPLGAEGSAAVALLCALLAATLAVVLSRPWDHTMPAALIGWTPPALALIPLSGWWRFRRSADPDYPVIPAVLFVLTLYLASIAAALVLPGH
ncbi:hypothetical protein ACWEKT_14215 [Nocardia takedensis]